MATTERSVPAPSPAGPAAAARPPLPRLDGDERTRPDPLDDVRPFVPRTLRISAALGWRLLVVGALTVIATVVAYLAVIVVPVAIALLLGALLSPAVGWLAQHHVPRAEPEATGPDEPGVDRQPELTP